MRVELRYRVRSLEEVGLPSEVKITAEDHPEALRRFWDFVEAVAREQGDELG